MSLSSSHQSVLDSLTTELKKANPEDIIQFCANHFNKALELERGSNRGPSSTTNGKMADTAGPFDNRSPFGNKGMNSVDEEDEERDTFGSPTDNSKAKEKSSSPFGGGFGAAAGGAAAGGLFGGWLGSTGNEEQADTSSSPMPQNYGGNRRTSVSAESMQPDADSGNWKPPKHAKTDDQLARLKQAVANNFLFSQLDEGSFNTVLGALSEKKMPAPNIKVISQGDEGDYFYVVEEGDYDVYIHSSGALQPGPDGMGNKVGTINPGGSFGELALMYNAPRAATIVSSAKGGVLWQLDRITFRRILMTDAAEKRKMYEGFLEEVPLLSELKPYERSKIADALVTVKFGSGENIITEGEPGDAFYLLESGEAQAFKHGADGAVKDYKRGDYFGELALLDDKPRAASVVAKGSVKVAKLGRDGFKRLLGPVESLMRREQYDNPDEMDPLARQKTVT